jgi:hypothetical protein
MEMVGMYTRTLKNDPPYNVNILDGNKALEEIEAALKKRGRTDGQERKRSGGGGEKGCVFIKQGKGGR